MRSNDRNRLPPAGFRRLIRNLRLGTDQKLLLNNIRLKRPEGGDGKAVKS